MSNRMEVQTRCGRWVLGKDGIARDKTYGRDQMNTRTRIEPHKEGDDFLIAWDSQVEDEDGSYTRSEFMGCPVEIVREMVGPTIEEMRGRRLEEELEMRKLRERATELETMVAKAWSLFQDAGVMREPDGRTGNQTLDELGGLLDEHASAVKT